MGRLSTTECNYLPTYLWHLANTAPALRLPKCAKSGA